MARIQLRISAVETTYQPFIIHFDLIEMNEKQLATETILSLYRVAQGGSNYTEAVGRYTNCITELKRRGLSTRHYEKQYAKACE